MRTLMRNTVKLICVLALISCNTESNNRFEGEWVNINNNDDYILIQKNEDTFFVIQNGDTLQGGIKNKIIDVKGLYHITAELIDDFLVTLDNKKYMRFDKMQYLGKWKLNDDNYIEFLEITIKDGVFSAIYKSEASLFMEIPLGLIYKNGKLYSSYYGVNNVIISKNGLNSIFFSINPFGEFEPIIDSVFIPHLPLNE